MDELEERCLYDGQSLVLDESHHPIRVFCPLCHNEFWVQVAGRTIVVRPLSDFSDATPTNLSANRCLDA